MMIVRVLWRFLMELKKSCSTKAEEYDERVKMRSMELVAIQETIKVSSWANSEDRISWGVACCGTCANF